MLSKIRSLPYFNSALILLLTLLLAVTLYGLRLAKTGAVTYHFLLWNSFLAGIPLLLAWGLHLGFARRLKHPLAIVLLLSWLAFFPNAPYVLTDLIHLRPRHGIPLWYDALLLFCFCHTALWAGFLSLRVVHDLVQINLGPRLGWAFVFLVILASAYGIYLGRFYRFNSWNLLTEPLQIIWVFFDHLSMPLKHLRVFGITGVLTVFLLGGYLFLVSFGRSNAPMARTN